MSNDFCKCGKVHLHTNEGVVLDGILHTKRWCEPEPIDAKEQS